MKRIMSGVILVLVLCAALLLGSCSRKEPMETSATVAPVATAPAEEPAPTAGPAEEPAPAEEPEEEEPEEQPEEGNADEDLYASVTALDKASVEEFAARARRAYLDGDWQTLSGMIRYPITMYPDVEVSSAEEFLSYMDGKVVHESDAAEMEAETCQDMFFNGQGICLGTGQIWLNDLSYMTEDAPQLAVIAVSGIVEADEQG